MEASSSSHSEPANGSPNREAGDTAGLSMQELSAAIDPDEDTRGKVITDYLLANVAEFRKLSELRKKVSQPFLILVRTETLVSYTLVHSDGQSTSDPDILRFV